MIIAPWASQNKPPSSDLAADAATSLNAPAAAKTHLLSCKVSGSLCFQPREKFPVTASYLIFV